MSLDFRMLELFLALIRTCAVFVGLAIYLKNRYIFLIVVTLMLFGSLEYLVINNKLKQNKISSDLSSYNDLVLIYCGLFVLIFIILFLNPLFKKKMLYFTMVKFIIKT